jgi:hypothetical protein
MVAVSKTLRERLVFLALVLALGTLYSWGTYKVFTSRVNGGNDFFSRYVAWRAFLFEGRNPYSDEVTHEIQREINGRLARPGEDENALIYPWYAVVVQWPFVFLPWPWARAVYMVVCQAVIVVGLALTARLLRWKMSPLLFTCTATWAVLFYPEARGIVLGQIVITQYLFAVLALWLIRQGHDGWAGVCLALTTVRPTAVFLFVPFLLVYAASRRRWRVCISFVAAMVVLVVSGFAFLPNWLADWIHRMSRYPSYTVGQSPVWLLTHKATSLGSGWELGLTLAVLCLMGVTWWLAVRRPDGAAFHWALGVTLVVSDVIVPRSATTNYVFLLFPIYLVLSSLSRSLPRASAWLTVSFEIIGLVGLWWLFAVSVQQNQEQPIMFIPQPLLIGLVLAFGYGWLVDDNRRTGVALCE